MKIPAVTSEQMMEVDRLMIEDYGISLIQMMENAGSHLADLAARLLAGGLEHKKVVVLCGAGNNGGGGMVAARHLHNRGVQVQAALAAPASRLKEIPLHQWQILQKMGIQTATAADLLQADLIIDALIGYGLQGNPQGETAGWIRQANESGKLILALDAPSGLDTTRGLPGEPCIRAAATLTLALPKTGLLTKAARSVVGELYLADISVPPELYRKMGLQPGLLFSDATMIKLPN